MELIVGALVVLMEDEKPDGETRRSDLDEWLAARCAAL
jgi:hypothetical protein